MSGAAAPVRLPAGMRLLERGWLSSNNIVLHDGDQATVVDSGYVKHAAQTVALVGRAAEGRRVTQLVNTHCHSDHVGGNAALQRAFACTILIPDGEADNVARWDEKALDLAGLGQRNERFMHDGTLRAGDTLRMGGLDWQALAAPGHDMDSLVYYAPEARLLISADALWEDGFGVLFPEFGGEPGLQTARETLDMIAKLDLKTVIPGHGPAFGEPQRALQRAYDRLEAFARDRGKLVRNALRVMVSFHLMDVGSAELPGIADLLERSPFASAASELYRLPMPAIAERLVGDLAGAGVLRIAGGRMYSV